MMILIFIEVDIGRNEIMQFIFVRQSFDCLLIQVKCTIDELMGIAFATSLPVVIASSLYESSAMDGLLEQRSGETDAAGKMHLTAPYFNSKEVLNHFT